MPSLREVELDCTSGTTSRAGAIEKIACAEPTKAGLTAAKRKMEGDESSEPAKKKRRKKSILEQLRCSAGEGGGGSDDECAAPVADGNDSAKENESAASRKKKGTAGSKKKKSSGSQGKTLRDFYSLSPQNQGGADEGITPTKKRRSKIATLNDNAKPIEVHIAFAGQEKHSSIAIDAHCVESKYDLGEDPLILSGKYRSRAQIERFLPGFGRYIH